MVKILLYKNDKSDLLEKKLDLKLDSIAKELNIPYYEMKKNPLYSYVNAKKEKSTKNLINGLYTLDYSNR